ncbi:hypothetical protein B7P43_G10355 [Cryptotermes secundus]|uniref:Mos1 transposase HTH domain-containing protein n=1 Tax=Cryptotermes secundus TaxID=105785 RepID=A0A2J7PZC5_9NEOP|nr:hypothetical protein B7P43_G10355 [Cryptotermes secundus]
MCKLEKSASEMLLVLQQVYGDTALKKSAVYDWFLGFKNGQMLEDDQSSGRPSTSRTKETIGKVRQQIRCDRRKTIAELEQEVGTVTGHFYVQVLQRLCNAVQRKQLNKWQGQWLLHHGNALSHTSFVVQQFLAEKNIPVITQSLYSLDLAPSDFWLFPTLKMGLKGTCFAIMEDIKTNAMTELRKIPKEDFHCCFQQLQDQWSKCVCAQGSYFEGD